LRRASRHPRTDTTRNRTNTCARGAANHEPGECTLKRTWRRRSQFVARSPHRLSNVLDDQQRLVEVDTLVGEILVEDLVKLLGHRHASEVVSSTHGAPKLSQWKWSRRNAERK
jgi:hypothetical protein